MVVKTPEQLWEELKRKHQIDEFFFQGVDLGRLPNGPITEVRVAAQALLEAGIQVSASTIAAEFRLKQRSVTYLSQHREIEEGIVANTGPRAGAAFPLSFEVAQYVVDGVLVLIASGFFWEKGADVYTTLNAFFSKRLGNRPEVDVFVRATEAFVQDERQIVVEIGRNLKAQGKKQRRRPRRARK
jgi:hypothetical protein